MEVQDKPGIINSLIEQIRAFGETSIAIAKLKAVDKASGAVASASVHAFVYIIGSRTVLLLSVASALLLGEWLGKYSYGLFIVTLVFALAGTLVYLRRDKWIREPVTKLVITKILE